MNAKLIEGALGMLARFIPPEEYAKATGALEQLVQLAKSIDERMKRVEALADDVTALKSAAYADSPAFRDAQAGQSMYMVPGTIEAAMAPSKGGAAGSVVFLSPGERSSDVG